MAIMIPGLSAAVKARKASRRARASNQRADWMEAVRLWEKVVRLFGRSTKARLQHAHALRRSGQPAEAVDAYRVVIDRQSGNAKAWLGYGLALKMSGQREQALKAMAEAARLDPEMRNAREELINYGSRSAQGLRGRRDALVDASARTRAALVGLVHDSDRELGRIQAFAPDEYAQFRARYRIEAPPANQLTPAPILHIVVRVGGASPALVRNSLQSLVRQTCPEWRAYVEEAAEMMNHPVASLAAVDPQISFAAPPDFGDEDWVMELDAGTMLHPQAIAWYRWAVAAFRCEAVYCDHDHVSYRLPEGPTHFSPMLQPVYDRFWFMHEERRPAALLCKGRHRRGGMGDPLGRAADAGGVAHIPLLLAARATPRPPAAVALSQSEISEGLRIMVAIPTRDNCEMLERSVETLLACAQRPDLLDIRIVSNRPERPESIEVLARLAEREGTHVIRFDEPFNWSRANNVAVQGSDADILLFVNDDTEMLTPEWDAELSNIFAQEQDVGAVGALLLYPQGGIQHAGIMMGLEDGGPQHEGRWQDSDARGPCGRWQTKRACSAVTGAFMAVRRSLYEALEGFDEQAFAIAYNDVDMCFRIREADYIVLYAPTISLIHHESVSRGSDLTPDMKAWDDSEQETLFRRWGQDMLWDPGYNPNFVDHGYPFDGYAHPALLNVTKHVGRSVAPNPWQVVRRDR